MKNLIKTLFVVLALTAATAVSAQVEITKVDKIRPTEEVFMDMAVSAAKTSVADNGLPCGAVVILNGAWRATGMPSGEQTAEQVAINKSRTKSLANARIYTVVQPTAAAMKAIEASGIPTVYFVVSSADAVAAGIHSAQDYSGIRSEVKMVQIPFAEATSLVSGRKPAK